MVQAKTPDFDDMHANVRAYPPAGVVVEHQPADQPEAAWTTLAPGAWTQLPTSQPLRFRWRAENPAEVEIRGTSSWVHTFPVRPQDTGQQGDEFNEPGLNNQWAVSVNTGKGKSIFRPENITLKDGNL